MSIYKYSNWSLGQVEALINTIGEDNAKALLAGDLAVERVEQSLRIKDAVKALWDKQGRRIPPRGLAAAVCDANREFRLVQPELDYEERLARLAEYLGIVSPISALEFQERVEAAHAMVAALPGCANLARAVRLPLCLFTAEFGDLGQVLDELFLPAVERSYKAQFPDRSFTNYRHGQLAEQVSIVSGSYYERFIQVLGRGAVVANYYPNPLQGFSVHAQREQMSTLPEGFILSGPLDAAMAWVMYPDVVARDYKTPCYDCSAVQWQSSARSLCFLAGGARARFGDWGALAGARDYCSGGLLFLG